MCPHALFLQSQSQIMLFIDLILILIYNSSILTTAIYTLYCMYVYVTGSAKAQHNSARLNFQYKALKTIGDIFAYY